MIKKLINLLHYRNEKDLKRNIKTKIELMILANLIILTQNPLNCQIYLDPDYGIKITTGDLSNGISYLTDNVIYGVSSNRIDIINLDGEVIKSIPLDIYSGLRKMISATNGRLYIAYTKEIDGLYYGFLRMYNSDGIMKEVMISQHPTHIKAIKATPNGVYLYAHISITFPCNVDGEGYSLCSDIEGRKIIYDLDLNEGVSLRRDVLYGDVIINENGEVVSIKTDYNTEEQRYESYIEDEYRNKYIIVSSSMIYPMNWGIDFKGDKLLMDYYEYDMDTNKLTIPQVMYLLNKTTKEVSTIRYPQINNTASSSIMRGEMNKGRIYLHTIHPHFHIPNIITSQNLNGELLWYISSDERAILDFAIDDLDRVYIMGIWVDILPPQYPPNASYIARYIQGAITSRWMIYKDTTTDMQIVSPQEKTKPFISVVKDGQGNGVDGVRVVWETNANWIEKEYDITSGGGISSNTLMINQVPPYEYRITGICNECITQMSSVTFTCCGKLKTDEFRQNDDRWGNNILGSNPPNYRIKQTGCALTTVANLINFYANISTSITRTDPGKLNEEMIKSGIGYNDNDDILWAEVPSLANEALILLESADVMWGNSIGEVLDLLNTDIYQGVPVIIRAERPSIGNRRRDHFMLVIGKCGMEYLVVDPAVGGVIRYNPYDSNLLLQGVRRYAQK